MRFVSAHVNSTIVLIRLQKCGSLLLHKDCSVDQLPPILISKQLVVEMVLVRVCDKIKKLVHVINKGLGVSALPPPNKCALFT